MTDPARNSHRDTQAAPAGPPPSFGGGSVPPVNAAQADAVSEWIKWHAVELAAVGVPLVLALAVTVWFALLAVPAAGLWAAHEAKQRRAVQAPHCEAIDAPAGEECQS